VKSNWSDAKFHKFKVLQIIFFALAVYNQLSHI